MGNAANQCPDGCFPPFKGAPNGNPGADAMVAVVAHELVETVSDPWLDAWYFDDEYENENADMCAWTYGATTLTSAGEHSNARLGTRDFLLCQVTGQQSGRWNSYGAPLCEGWGLP